VSRIAGLCAAAATALLVTACAASRSGSLASRFVKPGAPVADFGGPRPVTAGARDQANRRPPPAPHPPPKSASFGARLENTDPRLAASLLLARMAPSAEHQLDVAREYYRLGVLDTAYDRVSGVIDRAPRNAPAHELLARIWRDWQMPERALGPAYRATHFDPRSAAAWNTLGTVFERLRRFDDAQHAYEAAAQRAPAEGWPLNNLCHLELERRRLDAAQARCEAALKLEPDLAAAHNNLALVFAAAGSFERAEQEFLAAGDSASANYNLGLVYLADGRYDTAAERFEAAVKARPGFTAAKARAHAARVRALTGR
jgi:tetratricopeptide (TPR) repeat protein